VTVDTAPANAPSRWSRRPHTRSPDMAVHRPRNVSPPSAFSVGGSCDRSSTYRSGARGACINNYRYKSLFSKTLHGPSGGGREKANVPSRSSQDGNTR
jgi:hypothetical protein